MDSAFFVTLTMITTVLAAIFSFIAVKKDATEKAENARRLSDQQIEFTKKLAEQQVALVTGGDSYGSFQLNINEKNQQISLMFVNAGKYTLYDMGFTIVNEGLMKTKGIDKLPLEQEVVEREKYADSIRVGNLSPNQYWTPPSKAMPIDKEITYIAFSIQMNARNGSWVQKLSARKIDGKWIQATAIQGPFVPEAFREFITTGYPRLQDGTPDW